MDFLLLLLGWEPHTLSLQFLTRWKMRTIKNLTSDPCVLTLWDMALTGSLANLYTTEYSLYSDEIFSLSSLVLTHMRLSKQTFKSTIDNFIWLAILFSFWLVFASSVLWPFLVTKYYMEWTESFYQQKVSGEYCVLVQVKRYSQYWQALSVSTTDTNWTESRPVRWSGLAWH